MNIFISYAPGEEDLASHLATRLHDAGHEVWYSGRRVLPGDNIGREVGSALERADAMLVLVSPSRCGLLGCGMKSTMH